MWGDRNGRGETRILANQPGRHIAPVTAARNSDPAGLRNSTLDEIVQARQKIMRICTVQIAFDLARKLLAATGAPTGIGKKDRKSPAEEHQCVDPDAPEPPGAPVP